MLIRQQQGINAWFEVDADDLPARLDDQRRAYHHPSLHPKIALSARVSFQGHRRNRRRHDQGHAPAQYLAHGSLCGTPEILAELAAADIGGAGKPSPHHPLYPECPSGRTSQAQRKLPAASSPHGPRPPAPRAQGCSPQLRIPGTGTALAAKAAPRTATGNTSRAWNASIPVPGPANVLQTRSC